MTEVKNPLLSAWPGIDGGVPPFDKVSVEDLRSGLTEAIAQSREDMNSIASVTTEPTFENTILAMENAGELMDRIAPLYSVWSSSMRSPEFQKIETEMALRLTALRDEINQNGKLFKRIEDVYHSPVKEGLTSEQQRLVWLRYNHFLLQGARLNLEQKAKVAQINQQLSSLMTKFSQNVLADEERGMLVIEKHEDLDGLGQGMIEAAATEAQIRNLPGKWVISNRRSSMEPFLSCSTNRLLREKAFHIWASRGDQKNAYNNNKIASEILALRQERSKILGHPTYAHWKLADTMAKHPQTAMDLMLKIWKPALAAVKKEVSDMQAIVDREKGGFRIQPWDYRFYAEKVRKEKYDIDFEEVKPYLQLDKIRDAMFWVARELYGFEFARVEGVPVFHRDVCVYEVRRGDKKIGLWYFDPYARPGKSSGAWMNSYRDQKRMGGKEVLALVSNNSNFVPGTPGGPTLVSWTDAVTMFHEFGHALHGLSSNVTYPYLSGTNVTGDFVELPSQMHEKFLTTPEVLRFLTDKNGRSLPQDLVKKIEASKTFNEGFATLEFLSSAIVDMKLHLTTEAVEDMAQFEKAALSDLGMPNEIIMRHRVPHFAHIFADEGYAAGYYGYLWAQVLDNDAYDAFIETGDPFNKSVARKFFDNVLSVGNTVDPGEAYRKFRGRDAQPEALLKARGFL